MSKVKQENMDTMVRDFCSIVPKSKSEVRRRISSLLEDENARLLKEVMMLFNLSVKDLPAFPPKGIDLITMATIIGIAKIRKETRSQLSMEIEKWIDTKTDNWTDDIEQQVLRKFLTK